MANPFPLELGQLIVIRPSNPGAATNFTYSPSPRRIEQIIAIRFVLTTDANAATRIPIMTISDGIGETQRITSSLSQLLSTVNTWQFNQGLGNFAIATTNYAFLPPRIIIPVDGTLTSDIASMQAGDTITNIAIVLATWMRT